MSWGNLNILVGIVLGPTDLLESNKYMTMSIYVLPEGFKKNKH